MPQALPAVAAWAATAWSSAVSFTAGALASAGAVTALGEGATIALAGGILKTGMMLGLSAAATAMMRPNVPSSGTTLDFKPDPKAPVRGAMGYTALGGNKVFEGSWGYKNVALSMGVALSLGPIDGVTRFEADGSTVSFSGSQGEASGYFRGSMYQRTTLGLPTDPALLPPTGLKYGNPALTGWGSRHAAPQTAFAFWTNVLAKNVEDRDIFTNGVPDPRWIGRWMKVWQPRFDSTYPGGNGPQRRNDWRTWGWSQNPYDHALAWVRGHFKLNADGSIDRSKRIAGIGAPDAAIDIAAFVEGMNVADVNGWSVSGEWGTTDPKWQVLTAILQAGGGEPINRGAQISVLINMPRVSTYTYTKHDLIGGGSIKPMTPRRDRKNTIVPRYRSEAHGWEYVAAGEVTANTYRTEDRGEPRSVEIEYVYVREARQAGQLAAYGLANLREGLNAELPSKVHIMHLHAGDCITIDDPELAMTGQKVVIKRRAVNHKAASVTLEVRSETDAKHPWALGRTAQAPSSPVMSAVDPKHLAPPVPTDWEVVARPPEDETSQPVVMIEGRVETSDIASVIVEVAMGDLDGPTAPWVTVYSGAPSANGKYEAVGLVPKQIYWSAIRYVAKNGTTSERLIRGPVETAALVANDTTHVDGVPVAEITDRLEGVEGLAAANAAAVGALEEIYGDTASAAASAASAAASQAASAQAAADAVVAKGAAQSAATGAAADALAAAGSATAATNAKTAAETAKTAAETARTQAQTAKTAAEAAQTDAVAKAAAAAGSATTAAGSATTATQQANAAAGSASAAAASATAANTSSGNASASASAAATSASNALGSQNAAATSATVAASAKDAALLSASALWPERYDGQSYFITSPVSYAGGNPATVALAPSTDLVEGFGPVRRATISGTGVYSDWGHRMVLPATPGRIYQVEVEVQRQGNNSTGAGLVWIGLRNLNDSYSSVSSTNTSGDPLNGNVQVAKRLFADAATAAGKTGVTAWGADAVWLRPYARAQTTASDGSVTVDWRRLKVTDVTEAYQAQQSASASATSAASAAASQTAAGQSASAAATSATQANTARGEAQTFRNEAATSATNAAGSATTAATQAGLAATARDAAAGSATAAGNSATAASASATAAGNSASASQTSRLAAESARDAASGSASAAAGSASNAATSSTAAGNSASAAAASSVSASTSASNAQTAAIVTMPEVISSALWSQGATTGAPQNRADLPANLIVDGAYRPGVANVGTAGPKQFVRWEQGRVYELKTVVVGVGATGRARFGIERRDAAYVRLGGTVTPLNAVPVDGEITITQRLGFGVAVTGLNIARGDAEWIGFNIQGNVNAAGNGAETGSDQRFKSFVIRDITSQYAAENSANAAATSASSAAASQTAAGQSATAANQSKLDAQTAQSAASNSATGAANSATNAAGSAATATQQAGLAATARDAAAGSATAASTSAGNAAASATAAGSSATASQASSVSASTSATSAKNYAINQGSVTPSADLWSTNAAAAPEVASNMGYAITTVDGKPSIILTDNQHVFWKRAVPFVAGHVYEVQVEFEPSTSDPAVINVGIWQLIGSYAVLPAQNYQLSAGIVAATRRVVSTRFTPHADTVWIKAAVKGQGTNSKSPRIFSLNIIDVTAQQQAENSATAAATSASSAAASQTAAGQSASAAASSATAANTSAGNASTSANQASTSATTAAGSASTAGTAATNAANSRDAAAGSASAAAGSASTANTKAGEAGTSAAAAAASSVTASTAATSAQTATSRTLPSTFEDGSTYFLADGSAPWTSSGLVLIDTDKGKAWQANANQYRVITSKGSMPAQVGRTYRATAIVKNTTTDATVRPWIRFGLYSTTTRLTASAGVYASGGTDWETITATFKVVSADHVGIKPEVILNYKTGGTSQNVGGTVALLLIEDITSQQAAADSATAAATSASSAAASQTAAGQSASAAAGSATQANTSAGQASTFATQASTSATNAAGSASSASTSAGTAATARDQANAASSSAQASAATATTQASNAAGSAASASVSANLAVSVANSRPNLVVNSTGLAGVEGWSQEAGRPYIGAEPKAIDGARFMSYLPGAGAHDPSKSSTVRLDYPAGYHTTISAEVFAERMTAGAVRVFVAFIGSSDQVLDYLVAEHYGNTSGWVKVQASKVSPAGTVKIAYAMDTYGATWSAQSPVVGWRKIKIENGPDASPWNDNAQSGALAAQLRVTSSVAADAKAQLSSASFEVLAASGGDPAQLLVKTEGSNSLVQLVASALRFSNVVGGQIVEAMKLIGGDVFIAGKLFMGAAKQITFDPAIPALVFTPSGGAVKMIYGAGFGVGSSCILWFGPASKAVSEITRTNGVWAFGTDGKVYYGSAELAAGNLSAFTSLSVAGGSRTGSGPVQTESVTVGVTGASGAVTYRWDQIGGEDTWVIDSRDTASTTFSTTVTATSAIKRASFVCRVTDSGGRNTSVVVGAGAIRLPSSGD